MQVYQARSTRQIFHRRYALQRHEVLAPSSRWNFPCNLAQDLFCEGSWSIVELENRPSLHYGCSDSCITYGRDGVGQVQRGNMMLAFLQPNS
jgi:hypothetical protein